MMIEDKHTNSHFKQPSSQQNPSSSPSKTNDDNNKHHHHPNPLHNWMTKDEARFLIFGFIIWFTYFIAIPFIFETVTFVLHTITTFSLPLSISFSLRVHKQYISNNTYIQNNAYFQLLERDYMGIVVVVFGYVVLIVNNILSYTYSDATTCIPMIIPALLAIGTALLVLYTASRNLFLLYTFYNGRIRKETTSSSSSYHYQRQQQSESNKSRETSFRILTNLFAFLIFFDAMRLSNVNTTDILIISTILSIMILINLYLWNQWRKQTKNNNDLNRHRRCLLVAIIGSVTSFVILLFMVEAIGDLSDSIPMILYVATCFGCMKVCAIGCIVEYGKIGLIYWKKRNSSGGGSGGSNDSSDGGGWKKTNDANGDNQV